MKKDIDISLLVKVIGAELILKVLQTADSVFML